MTPKEFDNKVDEIIKEYPMNSRKISEVMSNRRSELSLLLRKLTEQELYDILEKSYSTHNHGWIEYYVYDYYELKKKETVSIEK